MLKRNTVAALALCLGIGWAATALTQDRDPVASDAERIAELVKQLGSTKFTDREKAKKELEGIGAPALEALKKASKDENLETSKRATELVRKIEDRILTAELLNPKRVRLNVKDKPAMEVVDELSRLSGYNLQVIGDRASLAEKKITLDTGEVSFWEALDRVCAMTGMSEQINVTPSTGPIFRPPIMRPPIIRRPIKIMPAPVPLPALPPMAIPGADGNVPALPAVPLLPPGAAPGAAPGDAGGVLPALPAVPVPPPAPPVRPAPPVDPNGAVADDPDRPVEKPVAPKAEPKEGMGGGAAPAGKAVAVPGVVIGPVQILPALPPPMGGGADGAPGAAGGAVPGFPGIGGPGFPGGPTTLPGQIQLVAGSHKEVPTSYAGSVRIRALTGKHLPPGTAKADRLVVTLDALGEPRLQGFRLIGDPTILKAIDEHGQELTVANDAPKVEGPMFPPDLNIMIFPNPGMGGPVVRQQTLPFKKGEKASKMLKELKGTVTAQAILPNEVVLKVDKIMEATGKTATNAAGGSLTVRGIEKAPDGTIKVKLQMENLMNNPFGGGGAIMINGGVGVIQIGVAGDVVIGGGGPAANNGMPDLVDAKGNKFQFAGVSSMGTNVNGGQITQEATVHYRPTAGTGDPASLVLFGNRTVNFQVPFAFRDVPLE